MWTLFKFVKIFLLILTLLSVWCECKLQPYKVLGVNRHATIPTIKKAYKTLAKEWHPDKNDSPDAQTKFIEINAAYEILNDPEKRKRYDNHGVVDDQDRRGNHPENFRHHFRSGSPFDSFFDEGFGGGFGGRGHGGNADPGLFHKQSITEHAYYNTILPESTGKPYLIMFYSDWCFTCMRLEPIWSKLTEELEPVGFGIVTVHAGRQRELTRKIGSNELPHIALLLDGRIIHYKDPQFSALRILEFVRHKLPYKMVEHVDDGNIDSFLNGWHDNRIRILLFGKTDVIRLRYLTTAFKYRSRAKLGYVRITNLMSKKTVQKYNVAKNSDTMLVFHENPSHPVAFVSMQDLALSTLFEVVESHKFLTLPRLSSQGVMDQICPPESSKSRKKLCVVLVNRGKDVHTDPLEELKRSHLRSFIQANDFNPERIRFAYILKDIQSEFVGALTQPEQEKQDLNVAIFWRQEAKKLKYEWFGQVWTSDEDNKTQEELKATLKRLLSPNEILSHDTILKELLDEHADSLPTRLINKLFVTWDVLKEKLTTDEVLPVISLIAAILFVVIGAQCMQLMVGLDDDDQSELGRRTGQNPVPELKLIEFKAETYNGLVRLLRPGCRTIILICDIDSKNALVSKFFKIMWPYRRNKTLNFGFMFIEKGLSWYTELLEQTTTEDISNSEKKINAKNCVGTVLTLNGHRRYFSMYHAQHPEGANTRFSHTNSGAAMGFDDNSDSEQELDPEQNVRKRNVQGGNEHRPGDNRKSMQENLLDGLPLWLDRLFEGSTQRYYINYWPEFPVYGKRHMHDE